MAVSDDECDLDTLSALLEEDSVDSCPTDNFSQQSSVLKVVGENAKATKDMKGSSVADDNFDASGSTLEEEEMDMEALSSLLEQDSDLEDPGIQQDEQEVTADDIAAFFNESSDNENEGEQEESECSQMDSGLLQADAEARGDITNQSESLGQGYRRTDADSSNDMTTKPKDAQHVKKLQDELVMMQQRMMEIQQMLASQTSTAATTPSPPSAIQPSDSRVRQQSRVSGSPKTASGSSSSASPSSSPSLSANFNSSKKARPSLPLPTLAPSEKKHSSGYSNPVGGKAKNGTPGVSSGHVLTNGACTSRLQSRSESKPLSQKSDGGRKSRKSSEGVSDIIKHEQSRERITSRNVSQPKVNAKQKKQNPGTAAPVNISQPKVNAIQKEQSRGTTAAVSGSQPKIVNGNGDRRDTQEYGGQKRVTSTFLEGVEDSKEKTNMDRKSMKRSLFGDEDSSSDWEDLEGEKSQLSNSGQEIKRLLVQGQKQRQAHTPSYSLPPSSNTTWKSTPESSTHQNESFSAHLPKHPNSVKKESEDKNCLTEKFSGLRIMNPKISSIMLSSKMEGRRMIPVSKLHLKVKSPELQNDWVTIGVIVHKSDARRSQTGKTYSIWKLSDLQDTDNTVSFFLFGQVYKQLWKMNVGNVIGLLNPNIMDSIEKSSMDVAFTVNNAQQVMEIGQSKDLGWCISKTKRGAACTNFINKKLGDFCTYHVKAAYQKHSVKRSELHGSCPGSAPKSSLKSKILQNNTFFYGGESYTASRGAGRGGGKKDKVTLGKLQSVMTQQDQRKISTLSIQNLLPADRAKMQSSLSAQHEQPFLSMLSVPTTGSMNLVRHIAKAEEKAHGSKAVAKGKPTIFQSVKAADLLKQHRQSIAETISNRKQQKSSGQESHSAQKTSRQENPQSKNSGQSNSRQTGNRRQMQAKRKSAEVKSNLISQSKNGRVGLLDHLKKTSESDVGHLAKKKSPNSNGTCLSQTTDSSSVGGTDLKRKTPSDNVNLIGNSGCEARNTSGQSERRNSSENKRSRLSLDQADKESPAAQQKEASSGKTDTPVLGKGFYPGGKLALFGQSSSVGFQCKPSSADAAKRKAIQKVQAIGGLERTDPNAVRTSVQNPDKIIKRVLENIENESKTSEDGSRSSVCPSQALEPPQKKSRLLGDVDPNSEEVQQLLKARSSHTGALAQAEAEREERYFDNLEKKEMMEEKMKSVTSMEVTVFTCEQCKYTAMSQSDRCKQEGHTVRRHKGRRRFFACRKCKHRTVSLQRYPTSSCSKCGEHSYEKTSMHPEKAGPKLESEMLCLRGDESKFINSLDKKVFMSTFELE